MGQPFLITNRHPGGCDLTHWGSCFKQGAWPGCRGVAKKWVEPALKGAANAKGGFGQLNVTIGGVGVGEGMEPVGWAWLKAVGVAKMCHALCRPHCPRDRAAGGDPAACGPGGALLPRVLQQER